MTLTRRGFLAASAAMAATTAWPRLAAAGEQPLSLTATTRVIEVDGRAATVMGLANGSGGQGLILDPGQRFRVDLTNALAEDTIIHWHGQIPPNAQDGVPGLPMPLLKPGETRSFDYAPLPGTFWMHSHVPLQEMSLLAAPLIVRRPEDLAADRQEVVMFLHDFSFRPPSEVMAELVEGGGHHDMAAMGAPAAGHGAMAGMDHSGMAMGGTGHSGMGGMAMDLNDIEFDAYLANDRTLADPEVIAVERGGRVLLRVINAAAATSFWIDTGGIAARLVAVDGHPVEPVPGTRFGLAMGQRLDLEIDITDAGAFPILALREGARERTGIVLATSGASVSRIEAQGDSVSGAFDIDLAQEGLLRAASVNAAMPLAPRPADRSHMIMLGGSMQPYLWTIDGRTWGDHMPITARTGERVHLTFHNMSMMGHPMHLHGHVFQVVNVNGQAIVGALRDTVYVPPMVMVTVALDAGEAARWMLHCHHMPHLFTGMMTEFAVTA
ncbi:multicopper oxidase family protein [Paracoccus sanguinis]|uniref:Multicopper oxidase with three cupredoxin domains (Includes cell division protein FtsP and spore coat protein CotA) n=2 Tax=Paracoccus sanguinis TaxID=1545044 RepID=A0A1H3CZR1_9RHOB|nr:multicopper oxidase family protein [Paracoccus sanguinis]KGJ16272.1 copper oxidase [Paracoccus sanguinis]SDX59368.1 Multicopper oxidase with three cupredoxin domains (includes cell division protein FtsP and spore coat protein CotA) [Paracoccus sanguinis]